MSWSRRGSDDRRSEGGQEEKEDSDPNPEQPNQSRHSNTRPMTKFKQGPKENKI